MPYKRVGNRIYVKKQGKWRPKATTDSVEKAKKMMRLLRRIEYGSDATRFSDRK
jgi:hypothetical protein